MTDDAGRNIEYLRVSITDRCNLRCQYCMPKDLPHIRRREVLEYEEILRICRAAIALGIRKFKVTGGEPLLRKGCVAFVEKLKRLPGAEYVSLTTNGVLLAPHTGKLAEMGMDGVTVSLDTLTVKSYQQLTGKDQLRTVQSSLQGAVAAGLRVKINCVPIWGINENELAEFAALASAMPVDIRFIELMPTVGGNAYRPIPGAQVRKVLREKYPDLHLVTERRGWGPAKYYQSNSLLGRIGFIDALSDHFCNRCNRVRLTSEGFFKLCLFHDDGISLRDLLRAGIDDGGLVQAMGEAIRQKPLRHQFDREKGKDGVVQMSRIGG